MNVSFDLVKHILDTLPIGYYIKRNIPVRLSTGDASYYDPFNNMITIGYRMIEEAFDNATDGKYNVDTEEVIRGLLYHEISHVVLSPNCLFHHCCNSHEKYIINVFEDERIETIFAHKYLNTNFKKNIIFLTNFDGTEPPKTGDEAFYHVVRYHKGKKEFINRVGKIIRNYACINRAYGDESFHKDGSEDYVIRDELNAVSRYIDEILKLYTDIVKDFEENKNNQQNNNQSNNQQNQSDNGQSDNDQNNNNQQNNKDQQNQSGNHDQNENNEDDNKNQQSSGSDSDNNESEDNENNDSSNDGSDDDDNNDSNDGNDNSEDNDADESEDNSDSADTTNKNNGDSEDKSNPAEKSNILTDKDVEDMIEDIKTNLTEDQLDKLIRKAFASVFDAYSDEALIGRLKKIIDDKLKEDNKNGAAISAYSGVFNPRAVARRDDYKWWSQQNVNGDIRRFSKVHFNLFIDNSGSFSDNDGNMNTFISALNTLRSKDFDFDVITINTEIVEWPDTKRKFESDGGTHLPSQISSVVKKHTQSQANNYNIVLFDGNAGPDTYSDGTNAFKHFDGPNTIIVLDHTNEKYIKTSIKKAKVIVIDDNYCGVFIDTVCNLLERVI